MLDFMLVAAGLRKSRQVYASALEPALLDFRLVAAGLGKSRQV